MKKGSTLFLKLVLLLIATSTLGALLWFPQTEGRAANLDLLAIYSDPFVIYVYLLSTSFFVGLYQAFKLLNLIEANQAFSQAAVNTLRLMKLASLSLLAGLVLALLYIRFFVSGEDSAGALAMGALTSFAVTVIATATAVFEKLLQSAVDLRTENDLTV